MATRWTQKSGLSLPATTQVLTGIIDYGAKFEGNLFFEGTLRIGGQFKGMIETPDTLIVSEGARVEGTIKAGVVIISGEVLAEINARHRVEIQSPAVFRGSIITPSLRVEEGVVFEGSSKMIRTSAEI